MKIPLFDRRTLKVKPFSGRINDFELSAIGELFDEIGAQMKFTHEVIFPSTELLSKYFRKISIRYV